LKFIVEKIRSSIQIFQDFEDLFASREGFQIAIGFHYANLEDFCAHIVHFYAQSFRYVFKSFVGDFSSFSKATDLHSVEIDHAATAARMKEAKALRDKILTGRR